MIWQVKWYNGGDKNGVGEQPRNESQTINPPPPHNNFLFPRNVLLTKRAQRDGRFPFLSICLY